jgi:hypothetical protein
MNRYLRAFTDGNFPRTGLIAAGITVALILSGCADKSQTSSTTTNSSTESHGDHAAAASPTPRVPAYFDSEQKARPFPAVLDPKQFSGTAVQNAYRYAAENPAVFAQQPCYCYCDGFGHRSLLDCFATDHGAT